jgi:tetratricopeptide (TPR) repeat protein
MLVLVAGWLWREAAAQRDQAVRNFAAATSVGGGVVEIVEQLIRAGVISTRLAEPLIDVTRKSITQLDDATPNEALSSLEWRLLNTMGIAYLNVPGQVENAFELAQKTHLIAERLYAAHPDRDDYGRHLVDSEILLGDAYEARGLLDTALDRFRAGRDLMQSLTKRKLEDGDRWRRLIYVQQRIGDTLRKQDDFAGALREYEGCFAMAKALAERPQPKADWLRALALAHQRKGDLYRDQSDLDRALTEFEAYRDVAARVVKMEQPNIPNWTWRLDLWIAHQRIGDILLDQGKHELALAQYTVFRDGTEDAVRRDKEQGEWMRFVANSRLKIGDALHAQGKLDQALKEYDAFAVVYRDLAPKDGRPRSQRNLAIGLYKMGVTRLAMNDADGALAHFQECLSMDINEGARDAQIITPLFVRKECAARAAQINQVGSILR